MKELALLSLIGEARDTYVLEAARSRQRGKVHRPLSRTALIAAVIVLALLLAGCVAVYLRLQDMKIGEVPYTKEYDAYGRIIEPTEKTRDILSLAGWGGSPSQQAAKEWLEFRKSYDPQEAIASGIVDRRGVPNRYWNVYACRDAKMMDKVDELSEKYGLKLLEDSATLEYGCGAAALEAFGLDSLFQASAGAKAEYCYGSVQPPYNFSLNLQFTLPDAEWPYLVDAEYRHLRKDYFAPPSTLRIDVSEYQQWPYTTQDGTKLLLILGQKGDAHIFAERADAYITVSIEGSYGYLSEASQVPSRAIVEKLANCFDYDIHPQPVEPARLQQKLEEAKARLDEAHALDAEAAARAYSEAQYATYRDYLAANCTQFDGTEYSDYYDYTKYSHMTYYYTFYDLDGDGAEEMLIGDGSGLYRVTLTRRNGEVVAYYPYGGGGYRQLTNGGRVYCEEPKAIDSCQILDYHKPYAEGQSVAFQDDSGMNTRGGGIEAALRYENGTWNSVDYATFPQKGTPITDAEAQAIMESYTEQTLSWYPLSAYPVDENGKTLGALLQELDQPTTGEARLVLYRTYLERFLGNFSYYTLYALEDINGDGAPELLLSGNGTQIEHIFSVRYGQAQGITVRGAYLCEGNVLEDVRDDHYHGGQRYHHTYYRMEGWDRTQVDFVLEDVSHGTWAQDLDGTVIDEATARAVMGKYPRKTIAWEQISTFPGM